MDQTKLQSLLSDLHRELSAATTVDPTSREMLEQVLEDIRQLTPEPADGPSAGGATAQLREAALRLEAEHPRLASAIGQLSDALARLGI
jgi:uncharacterized membrane protein YccC